MQGRNGYADAPKIALDAKGLLHLAFSRNGKIVYARSLDGGRSFEAPRRVSDGSFPSLAVDAKGGVYLAWELERGLGFAASRDGGGSFAVRSPLPGSADAPNGGANGGLQGKLADKLAVGADGALALVQSSFRQGQDSRVWLLRARPSDRSARAPR